MFDTLKKFGRRAVEAVKATAQNAKQYAVGALTLGGASMVASTNAHATGTGLADTALAAISGLESDVQAILVILVGVVFLFVLYNMIKKAR